MDYRLDYLLKCFGKIGKKKTEAYVVTRLWHLLDDEEVKIIPQQYVKRNLEQYALKDLYFPQIGFHVEINEPAHYITIERKNLDLQRNKEIVIATNHEIYTIDCSGSLSDINKEVRICVEIIKQKVKKSRENNLFKKWENSDGLTVSYHKEKGKLSLEDDPCLTRIEDICALFNAKVPKIGFQTKGGVNHPQNEDLMIWWPSVGNVNFSNTISNGGEEITEYHFDEKKRMKHISSELKGKRNRITFFRDTDALGFTFYRFKGIYKLDKNVTEREGKLVWRRIANSISL